MRKSSPNKEKDEFLYIIKKLYYPYLQNQNILINNKTLEIHLGAWDQTRTSAKTVPIKHSGRKLKRCN